MAALNECNIKEIALVRGYKKDITLPNIRYYDYDRYEETGELLSIFCAEGEMNGRTIILYGDIIFDTTLLEKLLKSPADVALVVDLAWQDQRALQPFNVNPDLVMLAESPGKRYLSRFVMSEGEHRVIKICQYLSHDQAHGECIGMAMFSEKGKQRSARVIGLHWRCPCRPASMRPEHSRRLLLRT